FADVVAAKQLREPPPPRARVPSVADDLDRLCMELLRTEPNDRPSGRDVVGHLRATASEPPPPLPRDCFVGRAAELTALRDAFDRTIAGDALTVLVEGESGVGKSTLVRRFAAGLGDALVFFGRCYERESVPYKAFDGIVDALSRWLSTLEDPRTVLPRD